MKKLWAILIILAAANFCFSLPSDKVEEHTLENGLTVFLLKDTSAPLVRVSYTARAGFGNQTKETAGFFKLYSRLFEESLKNFSQENGGCNSDSTEFTYTVTTSRLNELLNTLSHAAFDLSYSNDLLEEQLAKEKAEAKANATDLSGLINSAIDSRVFSGAPWKHDSGVNPAVFSKIDSKKARTILTEIAQSFYTPQNSALFISGNIDEEQILKAVEATFGSYYSSTPNPKTKVSATLNKTRKFVIHSPEFSDEMTQAVVQYTMLNLEEAEVMAQLLDNNFSSFKTSLLQKEELKIPGDEYINAAAAHKKDSSRLIMQTLMLGNKNTSSVKQVNEFVKQTSFYCTHINPNEFYFAQQQSSAEINAINSSSPQLMEKLSNFWAIEPYEVLQEQALEKPYGSLTLQKLLSRAQTVKELNSDSIASILNAENPFVFVIINTSEFNKHKKEYLKEGFEEVTAVNGPWYMQKQFAQTQTETPPAARPSALNSESPLDYYNANISQIKKETLINGIPLITKKNENTSEISIVINIAGGKLNSAQNHGLEEVMVNLLCNNINKEIYFQQQQGLILGSPVTDWESGNTSSYIIVNCEAVDFNACAKAVSNALIYGDIIPSMADRAVASRQYRKRLENGSAEYQMYSGVISTIYPKTSLTNIYDCHNEILQTANYQSILEKYPSLLDASRFKLIVTGNIDENVYETLNADFGLLYSQNYNAQSENFTPKFSNDKAYNVKLVHTFLTDIPAEKAGPMPAVLVPTTEFLDPVIYVIKAPEDFAQNNACFNAMLKYFEKELQNHVDTNKRLDKCKIKTESPKSQTGFATVTALNVLHTKELDAIYRQTILDLKKELNSDRAMQTVQKIKDNWTTNQLSSAQTNSGTALLLQQGLEYFPSKTNPEYYLEQYNYIQNASLQDFIEILNYFPEKAQMRFYSKDSKK